MKLWQKIFLASLFLVMLAVCATALFVSQDYFSITIRRERKNAEERHIYICAGISNRISFEHLRANELVLSEEQINDYIQEVLNEQADFQTAIAVYDSRGEVAGVRTAAINSADGFRQTVQSSDGAYALITDYAGREYYLIGSVLSIDGNDYRVFTASDFSAIYETRETALSFITIASVAFALISSGVLLVIVYRLLRPLAKVNRSISEIAGGSYETRAEEKGSAEIRELAQNVNIMAQAIEENIDELQNIADSRKRFIDNLAHEMKTPLTSIICLSDVMRIKKDISEEERIEFSGIIVEEAKRLKALSGKLLELIVAGNAELDIRPTSLADLLAEISAAASPVLENSGMRLKVRPIDATVSVDKELFSSLLLNLIDNARKASKAGDSVDIICGRKEKKLFIAVVDHGIGMSGDEIKKATEPFYMADKSRSRKAGGAGLGLALCAEIAKQHRAELKIASRPNVGTTVYIVMEQGGDNRA